MSSLPMNSFGGHFFPHAPGAGYFPGLSQHETTFRDIFRRRQDEINILNATTSSFQNISHPSFPVSSSPVPASAPASAPSSTSTSSSSPHPLFIPPLIPTTHPSRQGSPASTQSTGSKRKAAAADESLDPAISNTTGDGDDDDELQAVAIKRQRNTMAARKYRQKRLDKIADLERALEEMTGERDDLKIKLARREAEVDALKEILGRK